MDHQYIRGTPRSATGHYQDQRALSEVKAWCDAARTVRFMRRVRIGQLGYAMEGMGDFGVDETALLAQVGIAVHHLAMKDVAELLQIDAGPAGFLQSENVHRYPVSTNRVGIFVIGGTRAPQGLDLAFVDAQTVALEIKALLGEGSVTAPEGKAQVDSRPQYRLDGKQPMAGRQIMVQ